MGKMAVEFMAHSKNGKLDEDCVLAIKQSLANGMTPAEAASAYGVPYMVVYRIAIGETWKSVGDQIDLRRPREVRLTTLLRSELWTAKRSSGRSNAFLALEFGISESMVARALQDQKAIIAARIQRMVLTSGDYSVAISRYDMSSDEIDELLAWSLERVFPNHLKKELEMED